MTNAPSTPTDLNVAPVRVLLGQDAPVQDDDLAIINQRFAAQPLAPSDVFVFRGVASTDAVDSYFTRPDPQTTLRNYAVDLAAGQALLDSHDIYRLPLGTSFRAETQPITSAEGEPASTQVLTAYYLLRDHEVAGTNTNHVIRGIMGGTYRKMSIGFGGPDMRFVSEVDGRDLWESDFWPGQKLADGSRAVFKIVDGRALETSLVYKNAAPGALVQRVTDMAQQRHIPPADLAFLEQRWNVRFPHAPQLHVVPLDVRTVTEANVVTVAATRTEPHRDESPTPQPAPPEAEGDQNVTADQIRSVLEHLQQRIGKTISAASRAKIEDAISRAGTLQTSAGEVHDGMGELVNVLEALLADDSERVADRAVRAALGTDATVDTVTRLQAEAQAGRAYATQLIDETVQAKVAVLGDTFTPAKADVYRERLQRAAGTDFAFIQDEHEAWAADRAAKYTAGRAVGGLTITQRAPGASDEPSETPGLKVEQRPA